MHHFFAKFVHIVRESVSPVRSKPTTGSNIQRMHETGWKNKDHNDTVNYNGNLDNSYNKNDLIYNNNNNHFKLYRCARPQPVGYTPTRGNSKLAPPYPANGAPKPQYPPSYA